MLTALLSILLVSLHHPFDPSLVHFCRFVILFSSIIPISLRVNLDLGKTVATWMIGRDDAIGGAVVRNRGMPEELGRVEYVMTDKTGTLTRNGTRGKRKEEEGNGRKWKG